MSKLFYKILLLVAFLPNILFSQEICDNGIDDDGNGLIDLNDPSCSCNGFTTSTTMNNIPNPSFENRSCCPTSYSQMSCLNSWIQATNTTSDYFNCSYYSQAATNLGITPPSGTGYVGTIFQNGWKEYIGTCLQSPLLAGQTYQISIKIASFPVDGNINPCGSLTYGNVNISVFGSPLCNTMPVSTTDCPTSVSTNWHLIGSVNYSPSSNWDTLMITLTPAVTMNAIMFGPPCGTLPASYSSFNGNPCLAYFVYDDIEMSSITRYINTNINQEGSFCTNNVKLIASTDSLGGSWQWYKNGVALVGETDTILNISNNNYTPGNYEIRYLLNGICDTTNYILSPAEYPIAEFDYVKACDGTTTLLADSSTYITNAILSWNWDFNSDGIIDATGQNASSIFSGVNTPHSVTLIITDSIGCSDTIVRNVSVYPNPTANFHFINICQNDSVQFVDESTIANNSTNTINTWNWNYGNTNQGNDQNPHYTYTVAGNYQVGLLVTSNHGCKDSITQTITVYPLPNVDAGLDVSICPTTSATITATGATSYFWDHGLGMGSAKMVQPSVTTTYHVTGTDNNFCKNNDSVKVSIIELPDVAFSINDTLGCAPFSTTLTNNTLGNFTHCSWSISDGQQLENDCQPIDITVPESGCYNVELTVTTVDGCIASLTKNTAICVLSGPDASFTANPNPTNIGSPKVTFTNNSSNANQYLWNFGNGDTSTLINPSFTFPNSQDGSYPVILVAVDSNGCTDSSTMVIHLFSDEYLSIPNVFTPNNDGSNDYFTLIKSEGVQSLNITILNRWGNVVFESDSTHFKWNGRINNTEEECGEGVYFYRIIAYRYDDKSKLYQGFIHLVREN